MDPLLVGGVVQTQRFGGAERVTLSTLVIAFYVVCVAGVYAPWRLLGTEVASSGGSPARSFWDTGISDWGSGNSVVVVALLGVAVAIWCTVHRGSRLASAVPTLFVALFVVAARQILAYGETSSGWHWSAIARDVGWGLTLILVTCVIGVVLAAAWLFVTRTPRAIVSGRNELERHEALSAKRASDYLRALVVLTLLVVAFSQATWLTIDEIVGRSIRFTYRGDSNNGAGFITIVLGLALLLVCVRQLRSPRRHSPVVPSALVIANVVALANYYVAFTCPPYIHGEILFRLQWGFFVTLGATLLSALVLVGWWRIELAAPSSTTFSPRPPSQ